jgi:FAD/FMN-containing dehydrogenase
LNRASVSAFNRYVFSRSRTDTEHVSLDRFFFPLDALAHWNRLYGRRGLIQCQFVLPDETARVGIGEIVAKVARDRVSPFLAVLKRFGPGRKMMSFPMAGYTLAMDFAATKSSIAFLAELQDEIIHLGGRVYLAKDAVASSESIARSYPGLSDFRAVRDRFDPGRRFSSLLAERLDL